MALWEVKTIEMCVSPAKIGTVYVPATEIWYINVYNDGACSNSDVSKGFKDSRSNRLRDTMIQILNHVLPL